jgi:hypothetical protein
MTRDRERPRGGGGWVRGRRSSHRPAVMRYLGRGSAPPQWLLGVEVGEDPDLRRGVGGSAAFAGWRGRKEND